MSSAITYTSNLSAGLMNWLQEYAQKKGVTKRNIIEEALKRYQQELKKRELASSFKRAALDLETRGMAEEGLEDYNDQLNALGI